MLADDDLFVCLSFICLDAFISPSNYLFTALHYRYSHGVLAMDEDLAKDKDKIRNTEIVKQMLGDHPDWVEIAGIAYDAQSTLFASNFLDFNSPPNHDGKRTVDDVGSPVYSYEVRSSSGRGDPYCQVRLTEAAGIQVPTSIDGNVKLLSDDVEAMVRCLSPYLR